MKPRTLSDVLILDAIGSHVCPKCGSDDLDYLEGMRADPECGIRCEQPPSVYCAGCGATLWEGETEAERLDRDEEERGHNWRTQ